MTVHYALSSPKPALEAELASRRCSLNELLETSDVICVTLPLTEATMDVIGTEQFNRMKPEAIVVNTARGGVVNQAAMVKALTDGTIRAAGLDVYAEEPLPADSRLCRMVNVITLPHVGSATTETRTTMADRAVDNLTRVLHGKTPLDRAAPERIGGYAANPVISNPMRSSASSSLV